MRSTYQLDGPSSTAAERRRSLRRRVRRHGSGRACTSTTWPTRASPRWSRSAPTVPGWPRCPPSAGTCRTTAASSRSPRTPRTSPPTTSTGCTTCSCTTARPRPRITSGTGFASTDSGSGRHPRGPDGGGRERVTRRDARSTSWSPQEFIGPSTTGYSLLGQPVEVTAVSPTPPDFLTFSFEIDASAVPTGTDPLDVDVLREGVALSECTSASDPGPCVATRSVLPSGDWRFVAHSPQASAWAVATPIGDGPPPPDTTNPTVELRTPGGGAVVRTRTSRSRVDYDCADAGGAGLLSCVGDQADGASLDTSSQARARSP